MGNGLMLILYGIVASAINKTANVTKTFTRSNQNLTSGIPKIASDIVKNFQSKTIAYSEVEYVICEHKSQI